MAINYNFTWTDNANPYKTSIPTLNYGSIDTSSTSLTLNGSGSLSWGYNVQQNLLHLLENFASPSVSAPSSIGNPSATIGQLWYNTDNAELNLWTHPIVIAGSFISGNSYTIISPGTTDFTLIGSVDNNIGTTFIASGAGTGTGYTRSLDINNWVSLVTTDVISNQLTVINDLIAANQANAANTYVEKVYAESHYSSSITDVITTATTLTLLQTGQEFVVTNATNSLYTVTLPSSGMYRYKFVGGTSNQDIPYQTITTAGNFTIGRYYTIHTVGTTDFTLIGSVDNNIGTSFIATGRGLGNGTVISFDGFYVHGDSTLSVTLTSPVVLELPDGTSVNPGVVNIDKVDLSKLGNSYEVWSDGTKAYLSKCEGNLNIKPAIDVNQAVSLGQVLTLNSVVLAQARDSIVGVFSPISYSQTAIITNSVISTNITIGTMYTIGFVGTTDFTLIGAASNTVGLSFTAIGSGTGTGYVYFIAYPGVGLLSANTGIEYNVSVNNTISDISTFNITLPTSGKFRFKFVGSSNPLNVVNLVGVMILPDGTTGSCPINVAALGNAVEVWSDTINGVYTIHMSKCEGTVICKPAINNNEAINLNQFNTSVSASTVTASVAAVSHVKTFNVQTGTTNQFVLSDGSQTGLNPITSFSNASPVTVTVPANSTVAYPVGAQIDCIQDGNGKVTFTPAVGVTIRSVSSFLSIGGKYVSVSLIQESIDNWYLVGNLIA